MSPYIDLWERAWDQIARIGGYGERVKIVYVPAHRKIKPGMQQSEIDDIIGNDQADRYAKMGRGIHAFDNITLDRFEEMHHLQENYVKWLGRAITLRHTDDLTDVIHAGPRRASSKRRAEEVTPEMLQADRFAVKRRKVSWCNAHSRLAKQLVTPPERPAPPVDPARAMNRIIDRVQGSRPSKRIRQLRLHVWQQARRGRPCREVTGSC